MGCGSSATQRAAAPEEKKADKPAGEEEIIDIENNDPNAKKMVYNKKTGEYEEADPLARKEGRKEDGECFEEEHVGAGDKWGAVLPFLGAIVAPTKPPTHVKDEPAENYALEYVYGYRTYDTTQNLYYTASNKIVYCAAALGIVLDPATNTQQFFGGGSISSKGKASIVEQHDDDIISLAISPDRKYVATGQVGAKPTMYVWDADTCKMKGPKSKCKLTGKNARAVGKLCFSVDGKMVVMTDKSEDRMVYLVDVETGAILCTEKNSGEDINGLAWSKKAGDMRFATCGPRGISIWTVEGKSFKKQKVTGTSTKEFFCCTWDEEGNLFAGAKGGDVFTSNGNTYVTVKKNAIIYAINACDGLVMIGMSDGQLYVHDKALKPCFTVNTKSTPRALDKNGDEILCGLRNGTICTVSVSGKAVKATLMQSHHDGEIWGLDVLENGDILTTCDDNKVMHWSSKDRKCKGSYTINDATNKKIDKTGASRMSSYADDQCARAVCYNAKTDEVAIAVVNSTVQIRKLNALGTKVKELNVNERWIEYMAYSPNGDFLAVGTHKGPIVVFDVNNGYAQKGKLTSHKAAITSLDWSKDSKYIRSNCAAYELLFYDIEAMKQMTDGATLTRDTEWATQANKLGWHVSGIFPSGTDGTHINGVAKSNDDKLLVSGDDWGLVKIYRNPCLAGSQAKSFRGHSEHVVRVKFGPNDQYIFSVGGQDKCVMQWKKA